MPQAQLTTVLAKPPLLLALLDHSFYEALPLELTKTAVTAYKVHPYMFLDISPFFSLLSCFIPKLLSRVTFFILGVTTYQKNCFPMTVGFCISVSLVAM